MNQQDYILRMIEQMGRLLIALRKVIVGRLAGDEAIEQKLREAAGQVGFDLEIARRATPGTILLLAAPTGEVEPSRCWLYAELLFLDGLGAQLAGRSDEAWASYVKARILFDMVRPWGGQLVGWPEADDRIAEIDRRLADLEDGPDGGDDAGIGPDPSGEDGSEPAQPRSRPLLRPAAVS